MKVVSAYRKMTPYMGFHIAMAAYYDWIEALRMLRHSAQVSAGVETYAITCDDLPVPHYRYPAHEQKLMLWILEVSLSYLESDDFDQDTAFISPDCLVCGSLDLFGGFDLGISARGTKFLSNGGTQLMNCFQLWPLRGKEHLIRLHRDALQMARSLSLADQRWGADTIPLERMLGPIDKGTHERHGLTLRVFPALTVLRSIGNVTLRKLLEHRPIKPAANVIDFKYWRKAYQKPYFERVFGAIH